ncbi:Large ribosomal subunit protein eL6 - like 2 [Theobroma cacao]|nr:Large ribosomal subunit protein eL6 - like 2 [Theobroma cacao]
MAPKRKTPVKTRNPDLIRGVGKYSRSKMYHKRGLWAIKAKNGGVFPRHDPKPKAPAAAEKLPKFYPADDVKKPLLNKRKPKPTKLRASITPGTVLILLAGRFMGKRVVFLKQLTSGLLLVTGPFKINGVPLRRVNQSYVIATSTKVDISGVNVEKFDDKYFAKEAEKKKKKGEGEFFEAEKEDKKKLPDDKKEDQKAVDASLIKAIECVPDLKAYLAARFSLKSGMKPHELSISGCIIRFYKSDWSLSNFKFDGIGYFLLSELQLASSLSYGGCGGQKKYFVELFAMPIGGF